MTPFTQALHLLGERPSRAHGQTTFAPYVRPDQAGKSIPFIFAKS